MRNMSLLLLLLLVWGVLVSSAPHAQSSDVFAKMRLPDGFKIEVFAQVDGARSLEVVPEHGTVFIGTRGSRVYAVDLATRKTRIFARGLRVANGIAHKDGFLYIAEQHRVIRLSVDGVGVPEIIFDGLPRKNAHGWRYATFGPDGRLYVAVGAPCNICKPQGLEGSIIAIPPNGGTPEIIAKGVRNSVGLAFHPVTQKLYFTDNGADNMGDDSPPDELNRLDQAGQHFGYPWFGGGLDRTPNYKNEPLPDHPLSQPVIKFGAHVAPLGLHFYQGDMLPNSYKNHAFVAQHGSWNRSTPAGYRVVQVNFDDLGNPQGYTPFIEGWLGGDGSVEGRPVDIAELSDGSLLVSDDYNDVIWRISYAD